MWLRRDDQKDVAQEGWSGGDGDRVTQEGWPHCGCPSTTGAAGHGPEQLLQRGQLLSPQGPTVPSPLLACSALKVRNSAGGGLQVVGSMSPVACIFGFFSH